MLVLGLVGGVASGKHHLDDRGRHHRQPFKQRVQILRPAAHVVVGEDQTVSALLVVSATITQQAEFLA